MAEVVAQDPDVASVASFVGAGTVNPTANSGRLYISLKPREQRKSEVAEVMDRLREATRSLQGISLFMQAVQDVQIDSRVSRTQYQYTLQDADEAELARLGAQAGGRLVRQAGTGRRGQRPAVQGLWAQRGSGPRQGLPVERPAPGH